MFEPSTRASHNMQTVRPMSRRASNVLDVYTTPVSVYRVLHTRHAPCSGGSSRFLVVLFAHRRISTQLANGVFLTFFLVLFLQTAVNIHRVLYYRCCTIALRMELVQNVQVCNGSRLGTSCIVPFSAIRYQFILHRAHFRSFGIIRLLQYFVPSILYRRMWVSKFSWDAPLPEDINTKWPSFVSDMPSLLSMRVFRYRNTRLNSTCYLLGFCDASQHGYATVVYIRILSASR